jgi:hypothetical protein
MEGKLKPVCHRCGSTGVVVDALASWDEDAQKYVLSAVMSGKWFCRDCESETVVNWKLGEARTGDWIDAAFEDRYCPECEDLPF